MSELGKEAKLVSPQYIAKWLRRVKRDMIQSIREKKRFHPNDNTIDELERIAKLIENHKPEDSEPDFGDFSKVLNNYWICTADDCGKRPFEGGVGKWRWDGHNWQHHHEYPVGHVPCVYSPFFKDR